ncbi:MAG: D-glycerate dehydrogenase [Verrucomicrobiae bacterium]|nr:D-glycerate dehydrogenase [Verrucomicrobiae bacterium]
MRRPRVLIFNDGFAREDLADAAGDALELEFVPRGTRAQLLEKIGAADVYVPTLRIRVDAEVLAAARSLKLVATATTGTDHLDLALLEQRGIPVFSLQKDRELLDRITSTAEMAFALLLTCARHLPECFDASRQGYWGRDRFAGTQLSGKTLGIVGVGRLGAMMCRYGRAFGMQVLGCDPHPERIPEGVTSRDLDGLLAESDFVSLHVHLTEATRHLLDASRLARMKRGACLINTSRGGLIDEAALIREMESGRLAAVGLDVIDGEWIENKFDHPLIAYSRKNRRLYITPHVAGASPDAVRMTARFNLEKVRRFFEAHPLPPR